MVAVVGGNAALQNAGQDHDVPNETFTPDAGNVTTLSQSNQDDAYYDPAVSVVDNNGDLMYNGSDYRWIRSNGTVYTIPGGRLDNAPSAEITYGYQLVSNEQKEFAALLAQIPGALGLLLPAFGFVLFLLILKG
jgi:hypothetical protein